MKNAKLLVFITQLGLSVALPPAGFILLALWLRNRFGWGKWVMVAAVVLGLFCAIEGLRSTLSTMSRMTQKKEKENLPLSFNNHD